MPVDMPDAIAHRILKHFAENARELPWRNPPGQALPLDDPQWPFRVWLSEIMLQQTTVAAVKPYFEAFISLWPSISALAAAADEDVMRAWAGLGYYARARNLLACARAIMADHGGVFPADETELRRLPGIGRYTAAAISAIAFGRRAVVVDGNVERVVARLFAEPQKAKLYALADRITPTDNAGDFAQAMMDLGATVCTPRNPRCQICPVRADCRGRENPEKFPSKPARLARPERQGTAWWISCDDHVLLVTRQPKGLLGGMRGLPTTDWSENLDAPMLFKGEWRRYGMVTHIFTHFRLSLSVMGIDVESGCKLPFVGEWWPKSQIVEAGLPTLFAKAAQLARAMEERNES
ncbi:A/G-specific adenine glycosylase [Aquisediminimonas profunda]|uniref:A/G-specific adenine glycosylase n=1 Tax=Aquisediminimonas profunda TaxID=1550733 RepID=UPI001C635159|nr:A/G-specific adenine glycosylase [Aquisediminimonas profunda]